MLSYERRVKGIRRVVFMSFVFVFAGLQLANILLLKWGLKLQGRVMVVIALAFVLFCVPLPYLSWLISHARQPSFWTAALIVRPSFAWQFNWIAFLLFLEPVIVLARLANVISGEALIVSALRWLVAAVLVIGGIITLYGLATAARPPAITRLELKIPGLSGKDDGIRVMQFTDPHWSWWTSDRETAKIAAMIKELNPDLLIITGDLVDQNPKYTNLIARHFADFEPRLGKYGIIGNHDVYTGREEVAELMESCGVKMLRRGHVSLKDKGADLVLAGMDDSGDGWTGPDPWERHIPEIIAGCPKGMPIFWLGHRPSCFDKVIGLPVPLTLSGHTHGGQLRLPFNGPGLADIAFKHPMGFYEKNGQMLYVSRGTGTVGWPFRIGCPQEIALITLRAP